MLFISGEVWYIGFFAPAVEYYRANNKAPCYATQPQQMYIKCNSGVDAPYHQNTVRIDIGATTVAVQRGNASMSRVWP